MIRLQKYMAHCGVASRRRAEEMIVSGRVKVNDIVVTELGTCIDQEVDRVQVDGCDIAVEERMRYIALYKPKGYLSTVTDPFERPTVMELLKGVKERVYPVGRLDFETEGLLLFTNDGAFANGIMHPAREIEKEYIATVFGDLTKEAAETLEAGVELDGRMTAPCKVQIIKKLKNKTAVRITIHEGRNRQVRRMFDAVGFRVAELSRVRVGILTAAGIKSGTWRDLTKEEIKAFKKLTGGDK